MTNEYNPNTANDNTTIIPIINNPLTIRHIEQNTSTWLDYRRGRITGTKAKDIKNDTYTTTGIKTLENKLTKTTDETEKTRLTEQITDIKSKSNAWKYTAGIWKLLAEQLTDDDTTTDEKPMERGHRLENTNATLTAVEQHLENMTLDAGVWERTDNPLLSISPDACEKGATPTWAIECKSLSTEHHLQTVVPWLVLMNKITVSENTKTRLMYNELKSLKAFDHVPAEYQNQVIQYFLVNDHLQTVYFSMYDDRINVKALQHCVLVVTRESVKTEINEQKTRLDDALTVLEDVKSSVISLS